MFILWLFIVGNNVRGLLLAGLSKLTPVWPQQCLLKV